MLWDRGRLWNSTFSLNSHGLPQPLSGDALASSFTARVQHISDIGTSSTVYVADSDIPRGNPAIAVRSDATVRSQELEIPAAFSPLSKGYVGYAGAFSGEAEAADLVLEMCGVKKLLDCNDPSSP
ncbi:hypothetical protein C8Q77DRAFT_157307 [Trametes polyzona]|nr:hypothetical protein C8Q77DRAFT_157307 [Trametes polyzona]